MNVLSLFDGLSGAQIALDRLGIKVDKYFASEIDKYAIEITKKNYPNTIQVGSVTDIKGEDLPKIDLLIGGSPCQGFSFAGEQLNFEDPRSALFFEYVRLLKECKPKYFLLENVKMAKKSEAVITELLGVEPILIDSALVSGQGRRRIYWTNIPNVAQPEDKSIFLKDIIENGVVDRDKSYCLDASYYKGSQNGLLYYKKSRRQIVITEDIDNAIAVNSLYTEFKEKFPRIVEVDGETVIKYACDNGYIPSVFTKWGYKERDTIFKNRLLTPIESERLQTIPDNFTSSVSTSQRYKMVGNSFTVDVVAHILKNMEVSNG